MSSPGPELKSGRSAAWRGVAALVLLALIATLVVAGLRHRRMAGSSLLAGTTEEVEEAEEPASLAPAAQQLSSWRKPKEKETVLSEPHRELLERLQHDLHNPATRLAAVVDLYEATGAHRAWVPSMGYLDEEPENAMLREHASALCAPFLQDPVTIKQLLDSNKAPQHRLGLELWINNAAEAFRATGRRYGEAVPKDLPAAEEIWRAMTPRLRVLAEKSRYADKAITGLTFYAPENDDFLRTLLTRDKSPDKVVQLVRTTIKRDADRDPLLNVHLLRLLNDPDVAVRKSTLAWVWSNEWSAPMYWVDYSAAVARRIKKLRTSPNQKERELAESASVSLATIKARLAERREVARPPPSRPPPSSSASVWWSKFPSLEGSEPPPSSASVRWSKFPLLEGSQLQVYPK